MKNIIFLYSTFLLLQACGDFNQKSGKNTAMEFKNIPLTYAATLKDTTISDNYFGTKIKDPYRWLEDDQSVATKAWVTKQNLVTFGYLSQIPYRDQIKKRLTEIWNFEKFGVPFKESGKYYFFKNDGLQNQSILYAQDNLNSQATVLLDPNTFSTDGTASLQEMAFSKDGKFLAYATSKGGSDWRTILVKDLKTGNLTADKLEWAKFTGIAWQGDGFYYSKYPEPIEGQELTASNKFGAVYFHKLGTDQKEDVLVFSDKAHPDRYFGGNSLYFKDLSKKEQEFTPIVTGFENDYAVIDNFGEKLLVLTNRKAPNQRLVLINSEHEEEGFWEVLVPENKDDVLTSAQICGDKIICVYLHNASSALRVFNMDGTFVKEIELPEIGTVGGIGGKKGEKEAFFSFQSFLRPNTIYRFNTDELKPVAFKSPKIDFNPDAFLTEQVWYASKDGTKVPMFITRKRNISMDGQNPTLLYGYGGFNIPVTPSFSASKAALLENNGIYVVANIRGGGEFGETWHKAGTKCKKQNVFNDFIAAAEYLIDKRYTAPERLAIEGGSNGGLLVGACMTQRPDLFGVAFPRVGVLDMLRYHKFTIGYAWATDYGRSDNAEEFDCLKAYSPLHNLEKTKYPATMITTADHDDRVVPAHSFKFAAALQAVQQGENPTLIRIETGAGHGAGKPTSKLLDEAADMLSFMLYNMRMKVVY
jgi:prolyl oligopeptidase